MENPGEKQNWRPKPQLLVQHLHNNFESREDEETFGLIVTYLEEFTITLRMSSTSFLQLNFTVLHGDFLRKLDVIGSLNFCIA